MTALPSPFTSLRHVVDTGSTNADLAADGQAGDVLVTDHQTAGRGRFDRRWEEPPGSSLLCSVRLEVTAVPGSRRGWIPLTAGLALAEAVGARLPGALVGLKWPNDVFVDGRKVAGILAELAGDAVVIGMGCNLTQSAAELFSPDAASLATAGATDTDRDALLHALLAGLGRRWAALADHTGHAGLVAEYRTRCVTLGRTVRVELGDGALVGEAVDVDTSGALVVAGEDGRRRTVSAGDVVHLR